MLFANSAAFYKSGINNHEGNKPLRDETGYKCVPQAPTVGIVCIYTAQYQSAASPPKTPCSLRFMFVALNTSLKKKHDM